MKVTMKLFFSLLCIVLVSASSPPTSNKKAISEYTSLENIWKDNVQNQNPNVALEHQTRSDAMQLYSIKAKQIVKVKEEREKAWEQPNYELTMTQKSRSRRDNKFVTETVSYQRLKIRSADNQKYLCARTNGEIVFKETADKEEKVTSLAEGRRAYSWTKADKKNKPRKRCLFFWEFTSQMHIKLSLEAGNKKRYYLSVKDNVIKLREEKDTTELERSFIWLPTKPLKGQTRKAIGFNHHARSRKFEDTPSSSIEVVQEKDKEIQALLKEVNRLQNKIEKIKGLTKMFK